MADQQQKQGAQAQSAQAVAEPEPVVGKPTPASLRALAEDLPEKDAVQKAYKAAMLADTSQEETKHKVKVVDESPDAAETPSGAALKKVAGISDDGERGERYAREKTAVRWGYVPVDES